MSTSRPLLGEYAGEQPQHSDDTAKLHKRIKELESEVHALREQVRERGDRLYACERPMQMLRKELSPLRNAINAIFGELDAAGIGENQQQDFSSSGNSRVNAIWNSWIQKLPGKKAEFIRALLEHGEMTAVQLKIATHTGTSTVPQVIHQLKDLGLIEKNGSKYSLKPL